MSHELYIRRLSPWAIYTAVHTWTNNGSGAKFDHRYWLVLCRFSHFYFGIRWPNEVWPWTADFWISTRLYWAFCVVAFITVIFA